MGRQKRELKNCKCCGKETYTAKGYCRDCNDSDLRYIKQQTKDTELSAASITAKLIRTDFSVFE